MVLTAFLLVLVSVSILAQNYGPVTRLKLFLREEKLSTILYSLIENSLEHHQISTKDLINLSKLDRYDVEGIVQVFDYYNVTPAQAFTVNNLRDVLQSVNLTFNKLYTNVTEVLNLTSSVKKQIVESFGISVENFFLLIQSTKEQEEFYKTLNEGVYSEENLNAALRVAGKKKNQVYEVARDFLVEEVEKLASSDFVKILRHREWNKKNFFRLCQAVNLTTSNIYGVEKFQEILTNITLSLNSNVIIGVYVEKDTIALHEKTYRNLLDKEVDSETVRAEANEREIVLNKTRVLGEHIVGLFNNETNWNCINITDNYNSSDQCKYVTHNTTSDVEVVNFSIKKSEKNLFVQGSALICQNSLYGLAGGENESSIFFDTFFTEDNPPPVQTNKAFQLPRINFYVFIVFVFTSVLLNI